MLSSRLRCLACTLVLAPAWSTRNVSASTPVGNQAVAPDSAPTRPPGDEPPASARSLLEQGVRLRKEGDDQGARRAFEQAWRLAGSPEAMAQWALAEQALGRWVAARERLLAALERGDDPWIAAHRSLLDAALAESTSHLGELDVACNVAGAELLLDGLAIGRTPLAQHVSVVAGQSVLSVSAAGYYNIARTVQVDPGGLARVEVTLTPNVDSRGSGRDRPGDGDAAHGNLARDAVLYGSAGVAALGAAGAATGYVLREVNVKRFNDDQQCDRDSSLTRSEECPDAAAAFRRGEVIAIAGVATAGVLGGIALYLWLSRPQLRRTPAIACSPGGVGLLCAGSF